MSSAIYGARNEAYGDGGGGFGGKSLEMWELGDERG